MTGQLPAGQPRAAEHVSDMERAWPPRRSWRGLALRVQAIAAAPSAQEPALPQFEGSKRVLVLGGTGRVGSSTAASLASSAAGSGQLQLVLAGRREAGHAKALARWPQLKGAAFQRCDIDDPASIRAAIRGADMVVHCAGPFQRRADVAVLEAAIQERVPYMDVCDDTEWSQRAKALHSAAQAAGVPCITTGGIYPGVSNVMAAHMISIARKEYAADWSYAPTPGAGATQPRRLLYSYFTAGSGGAGPTILETSLLLAGEEVVAFKDGQRVGAEPVSERRVVDFGAGVGRRSVYLYPLPEVLSGHQVLGVPSVSARFGTDPDFWNWGMVLMARLAPRGLLRDRQAVKRLAALLGPAVRAVDAVVGEKVAMLVEVELEDGKIAAGLYVHTALSRAVGTATAAFARCMLAGQTQPGVWYPEEPEALSDRRALLALASDGCTRFLLNRTPWQLETDPVQLGMGLYF